MADFMVSDGTNFSEFIPSKADGIVDYNNPNNVIKLGWSGNSFTAADFTYALGLNNDKKIKDVYLNQNIKNGSVLMLLTIRQTQANQ